MSSFFTAVWAVHIADGVLGWPILAAGFAVAGVLTALACWRLGEEEVPRIALLNAAFFVASSIHVKLGPTSVHLLLNGLVGVVLGWRAPLAILIGVFLQALLIPHGGLTTVGVNAATEMLPALAAGALFPWLLAGARNSWTRVALVAGSAATWGGLAVFVAAVLATNPWRDLVQWTPRAGLVIAVENFGPAVALLLSPWTLAGLVVLAGCAAWFDRRLGRPAEFPAGACVGALAVIGTTLLTGLVLIGDHTHRWGTFASAVVLAHLPLALLEGLLLGVVVTFLARVKPEMLPGLQAAPREANGESAAAWSAAPTADRLAPLLLLGLIGLLCSAGPVRAHQLDAEARVDRQRKQVTVESWYETGDVPKDARVKVLREDGDVLAQGPLDAKGAFTFRYEDAEPLRIEVSAPGGHRAVIRLSESRLGDVAEPSAISAGDVSSRGKDLLLGLTCLLSLASFVLGWLNARRLRQLSLGQASSGNTSSSATSH